MGQAQRDELRVAGRVWLEVGEQPFLGRGRIELLERIAESGSISAAARAMGMSYKAAWDAVDAVNNLSATPLVVRTTGGRHGGGTRLTDEGRRVVAAFRAMEAEYRRFLEQLGSGIEDFEHYWALTRRLAMKTSVRNVFRGRVKAVREGAVNDEVVLDLGGGDALTAVITRESTRNLGLAPGKEALALVKAPWIILTSADGGLRTSARNRLCGKVSRCVEGAVNAEVVLELPGGKTVTAIITNESVHSLGLAVGVKACALIKASHVILAVED